MKLIIAAVAALALTAPAEAQMDHSSMPGMKMSPKAAQKPPVKAKPKPKPVVKAPVKIAPKATAPAAPQAKPKPKPNAAPIPQADMSQMPGMEKAQSKNATATGGASTTSAMEHDMSSIPGMEIGDAPAPAPPTDHAADVIYNADEMKQSRDELRREHGAINSSMILFDLAEYIVHEGKNSYRWEGEAWSGGDINRFVLKYEVKGELGGSVDDAEFQAVYSRAVSPFWNLQAGIRYDVKPDPSRGYLVLAVEGLAPYWFKVTGAGFVSNKGEVRARLEASYDQRITQRLILQPRIEANLSAQNIPSLGVGAGVSNIELGARLRYEIQREFAPYIGVEWVRQFGESASFVRANGGQVSDPHFVAGIRFWF